MKRVVVVGGGVAGTAAALLARAGGASVSILRGRPGSSILGGGAIDDAPWEEGRHASPLDPLVVSVLDALGAYRVGERAAHVAVTTGLLRPARGVDAALLDLASLGAGTLLVPDVTQGGWDGESLAEAWSASPLARESHQRFVAVDVPLIRRTEEARLSDADLAILHDDPGRLEWLAARLIDAKALVPGAVGVLLPPWLGVERERATSLSQAVGIPCGEALGGVGGPPGLRFERARDRALSSAGVIVRSGWALAARRLGANGAPWGVLVSLGDGDTIELDCEALILATGGILGGGLEYAPSGPPVPSAPPRPVLRVTCDAPVTLGTRGRPLEIPSSLFGGVPESHAWPLQKDPLLGSAGVLVGSEGRVAAAPGLFAVGELVADAPRTWLAALASGARAGRAAREP